ncbi:MAG: hypothetical protein JXQ87_15215 [Bacteroidia bacterium]
MNEIVVELLRFNERHNEIELENSSIIPRGSKVEKLLSGFRNNEIAMAEFDGVENKAFMMLRLELLNKLVELTSKVALNKVYKSRYLGDYFKTLRDMFWARVLLSLGMYQSGLWLLKKSMKKAELLENWEAVLTGSNILISYYAVRGDYKSGRKYSKLSNYSIEMVSKKLQLSEITNKWVLIFSRKRSASKDQIKELGKDVRKAKRILGDIQLVNMVHMVKRIELMYLDAKLNYEAIISLSEETKRLIIAKSGYSDFSKLGIYIGIQMYAYLNLKKIDEAKKLNLELDQYISPGVMNWFIFMEYYFVLLLQSGEFYEASLLIDKIENTRGYRQLKGVQKDIWVLLTAYMQFVAIAGVWKNVPKSFSKKTFKANKFINEVLNLGGDKTGLNVSVLILQVLFLLHYQRYEEIIDKKDALKRYVTRYLNSKENNRSRLFMTMLLRMIDVEFSFNVTLDKTKRLQTQLSNQEMNYRANLGGNEIMDYELLWHWVLNTLKTQWPKSTKKGPIAK